MQHKQKLLNKENNWNELRNYKPNDVVSDDGKLWQNVSGINTKPGSISNNDWAVIDDSIDYAKVDFVNDEIDKIKDFATAGIVGSINPSTVTTDLIDGVYHAQISGTYTNAGNIVVKDGYYTLLRKNTDDSWVLEIEVEMPVYNESNLIESDNPQNKNAFKSLSLKGNWKNQGLWIETLAYTSFNKKLNLVIKDKTNKDIFVIAGKTVDGRTEIELISTLIEGTLVVDFSEAVTFQEIVRYPFVENQIFDNNNYLRDVNYIPDLHIIADKNNVTIPNRILAHDKTNVPDANYSITDLIPVRKGMNLTYRGKNNASSTYFDLAHIYDEFGAIVQKINRPPVDVFFKFDITAETAYEMRLVVSNESKENFILVNNKEIEKPKRVNFENIDLTFITGTAVAFDGSIITSGSWRLTDYIKVRPKSKIGYQGFLAREISIALYDANKRFIKSVIRPTGSEPSAYSGTFETTEDTMYTRVSVGVNYFSKLFYIKKNNENVFPTLFQGYKNGENFSLNNGISFVKNKEVLDDYANVLEADHKSKLFHNFSIANRNYSILKNKTLIKEVKSVSKGGVIFGYEKAGDVNTILKSKDGGLTYDKLFDITDAKINGIDPKIIVNADGILYLQAEIKQANFDYAEKTLYRAEYKNLVWEVTEVLKAPHAGNSSYVTFSLGWGFSHFQNIVVVNDYGTQGVSGKLWVSEDFGKTFVERINLSNPPFNGWISGGHVHGSSYDPIFNRIWVSTGDGYTNTYVLYSDDLGVTWSKVQAPYAIENGLSYVHTQFVGVLFSEDFMLFNHDSERAGVYRYNRGLKSDKPLFEWCSDVTNHSKMEMLTEGLYAGNAIIKKEGVFYSLIGWHDIAIANSKGILGKILVSKDGYNWDVFYQDTINPVTNRGYITNASLIFVTENNVIFNTENDKWVYLDKPS